MTMAAVSTTSTTVKVPRHLPFFARIRSDTTYEMTAVCSFRFNAATLRGSIAPSTFSLISDWEPIFRANFDVAWLRPRRRARARGLRPASRQ